MSDVDEGHQRRDDTSSGPDEPRSEDRERGIAALDVSDPIVAGASLGTDGGGVGLARGIEALEGSSWAGLEEEAATGEDGEVDPAAAGPSARD